MGQSTYLSGAFVEEMMRAFAPQKNIRVMDCQPVPIDNSASILAVLTAGEADTDIGHAGLAVTFEADGQRQTRRMVLKIKPHGDEIVTMLAALAGACGEPLARVYPAYQRLTGFQHTHTRELAVYGTLASPLFPDIFGVRADPARGRYLILMEYLEDVTLLNSVMTPERWTDDHIRLALRQMAVWHARFLNHDPFTSTPPVPDDRPGPAFMLGLTPLWEALLQNAADTFPDLYTPARTAQLRAAIRAIPDDWAELEKMPKTLIHNDLNPRNTCFKTVDGTLAFCVYDWELATRHVPQYDVVELLCFVLDADRYALRLPYLEIYRQALHDLTGAFPDPMAFRRGFDLAALDFGLHRLGMYMMAHSIGPYPFLPRVVNSYFETLAQASV